MHRKTICLAAVCAALLVCILAYFRPLSFSGVVGEDAELQMVLSTFRVDNGRPFIDVAEYKTITAEQHSSLLSALGQHSYRRTFITPFSDGTVNDVGEKMLSVHVFDGLSGVNSITITSAGHVLINDKSYAMQDAARLIEQLVGVVEQA